MQIFLQFIHQVEDFSFTNLRIFVKKKECAEAHSEIMVI